MRPITSVRSRNRAVASGFVRPSYRGSVGISHRVFHVASLRAFAFSSHWRRHSSSAHLSIGLATASIPSVHLGRGLQLPLVSVCSLSLRCASYASASASRSLAWSCSTSCVTSGRHAFRRRPVCPPQILFRALAVSLLTGSRAVLAALWRAVFSMYRGAGGMAHSFSRAAIGVRLYAPAIFRRHWFWTCWIGFSRLFVCRSPLRRTPYVEAPYIIVGRTTAVYRRRERFTVGPHVDAMILDAASNAALPFCAAFWMCCVQRSFGSTHTPRTRMLVFWRVASCPAICTVDDRSALSWCLRLVKCISWYFSGANEAPWRFAHATHRPWASVRRWQFSAAEPLHAIRLVSSTKPNTSVSFWVR